MRLGIWKKIFVLITFLCVLYILVQKVFWKNGNIQVQFKPIIIWWTELLPEYQREVRCGMYNCLFTVDRNHLKKETPMAIAFYASDINITDLPLPRLPNHIWALMHEESPKNVPYIQFESVLKHFNLTATFSRYSDFPLTTQYIESIEKITTKRFLIPVGEKTKLRKKEQLAPVAFVQSICDTMSGRDQYVRELMNFIEVDSYGGCLNNKNLPKSLSRDYLKTIDSEEFYKFLARYKFIIAYENGVCNDYITEKFWRAIYIGSIPVYFGSPTIKPELTGFIGLSRVVFIKRTQLGAGISFKELLKSPSKYYILLEGCAKELSFCSLLCINDWLPNKKSAILISDFDSPKALAEYLKYLDENDYEYNKYLDHKYSQINPVSNQLLKKNIIQRGFTAENTFFEAFECFLCEKLYTEAHHVANKKHYDCEFPLRFPKMETNMKYNTWTDVIKYGRCQAEGLNHFLLMNKSFTQQEFNEFIETSIKEEICKL